MNPNLIQIGEESKASSRKLANVDATTIDNTLGSIAQSLLDRSNQIIEANLIDINAAKNLSLDEHIIDRLLLNKERIQKMCEGIMSISRLPSPIGIEYESKVLENGIELSQRSVPLGVIGVIYESRPNITVDISALCLKSNNAVILRGGKESINSNICLTSIIKDCLLKANLPENSVQLITDTDRRVIDELLKMDKYIDFLIPRGGSELVNKVATESRMPTVVGGIGVCHTYVDKSADLEMANRIILNAKTQRPSVCNALDTVLIHSHAAPQFLPLLLQGFSDKNVEMRCDTRTLSIIGKTDNPLIIKASEDDFGTEFLSLTAAVKIVDLLEDAIEHINNHGFGHSEAIITEDQSSALKFVNEIDASAVFVNASTRLNDGGEFGLGAEIAISTGKTHARGPMGLKSLTSYKWIALGSGQIRID
ncbi:MAG: glutamate-5-semialdehyde dehydrogenase [Chloroflexi bacterium]|jgi:glutamate-5-semialdehyde dehydrogenase|nr:MAG: glutamate-5-semialdehyde dehydrogenase [Chloroflexota bacterium]